MEFVVRVMVRLFQYLIGHYSDFVVQILHDLVVLSFETIQVGHINENVAINLKDEMTTMLNTLMHFGVFRLQRLDELVLLDDCLPDHFLQLRLGLDTFVLQVQLLVFEKHRDPREPERLTDKTQIVT